MSLTPHRRLSRCSLNSRRSLIALLIEAGLFGRLLHRLQLPCWWTQLGMHVSPALSDAGTSQRATSRYTSSRVSAATRSFRAANPSIALVGAREPSFPTKKNCDWQNALTPYYLYYIGPRQPANNYPSYPLLNSNDLRHAPRPGYLSFQKTAVPKS